MHGRIRGTQGAAMTDQERKHLAQADRHIAECKGHIARQEKVICQMRQRGQETEVGGGYA